MRKFNYFLNREERSKVAKEHVKKMDEIYHMNTQSSVDMSVMYDGTHVNKPFDPLYDRSAIFVFNNTDTVSALFQEKHEDIYQMNPRKRYTILNFASFKNPGGKFLEGSSAQEECLCHSSNLYNILVNFKDTFYIPNKKRLNNSLYTDHLLYTPAVVFDKSKWDTCTADVITCAAPNKTAAQKYRNISDDEVSKALRSRVDSVLMAAYLQGVNVLILGAFGCGVFGNDVEELAGIYRDLFDKKYRRCFRKVVFAIPTLKEDDNTFNTFMKAFIDKSEVGQFGINDKVYYGKYEE